MSKSEKRSFAFAMTISVYPHEKEALIRIMREEGLKSTFDVVRKFSRDLNRRDFEPPKKKNC
jgi:hypothetical protein